MRSLHFVLLRDRLRRTSVGMTNGGAGEGLVGIEVRVETWKEEVSSAGRVQGLILGKGAREDGPREPTQEEGR